MENPKDAAILYYSQCLNIENSINDYEGDYKYNKSKKRSETEIKKEALKSAFNVVENIIKQCEEKKSEEAAYYFQVQYHISLMQHSLR
jgi:hypothetical protein